MPAFDLAAYAARIGAPVPDTIDLPALQRMHQAHVGAIAFENLDAQWRRTVRIDPTSVWAKLVGSARGGYCFEQNTLFREVLRARGVTVTAREARVRSGATTRRARTHMTLVARIAGDDYLCDVGFGAYTPLHPVPLSGEPSRQHAWVYRLAAGRIVDGAAMAARRRLAGSLRHRARRARRHRFRDGQLVHVHVARERLRADADGAARHRRGALHAPQLHADRGFARCQLRADAAARGDRAGAAPGVRSRRARRARRSAPSTPTRRAAQAA